MKTVELLLVTSPIEEARATKLLAELRKAGGGVKLREVGRFPGNNPSVLTSRQTEVLRGIALGTSAKEIATQLGVSAKTVETHRAQLMERLGIRRVSGLVRYAIQAGAVSASWLAKRDAQ